MQDVVLMADRRDIHAVKVQVGGQAVHRSGAAIARVGRWRSRVLVRQCGAVFQFVFEGQYQPVARMQSEIRRLASVAVAVAVMHLAERVAEVGIRQLDL